MFHNTFKICENQEYQQILIQRTKELKAIEEQR